MSEANEAMELLCSLSCTPADIGILAADFDCSEAHIRELVQTLRLRGLKIRMYEASGVTWVQVWRDKEHWREASATALDYWQRTHPVSESS